MNVPGPLGRAMESPGEGPALGRPVHHFSRHFASKGEGGVAITQWDHSHASHQRRSMQHDRSLIRSAHLGLLPIPRSRGVTSCVPGTHDLPGLARFWAQALGWRIPSRARARERHRARENAPAGRCFLPATDRNTVHHRVQPGLTSSAADHKAGDRPPSCPRGAPGRHGQTGAEPWPVLADSGRS